MNENCLIWYKVLRVAKELHFLFSVSLDVFFEFHFNENAEKKAQNSHPLHISIYCSYYIINCLNLWKQKQTNKKKTSNLSVKKRTERFFFLLFKAAKCNRQAEYFDWPSETN